MIWLAAVASAAAQEAPAEPAPAPAEPAPAEPEFAEFPPQLPPPVHLPPGMDFDTRAPLLSLGEVRYARVRRSNAALLIVSGLEVAAGAWLLVGSTAGDSTTGDAGTVLALGGIAQGTSALYQVDIAQRRHATFAADLAAVMDDPEARDALARSMRLQVEREARLHAMASGVYGSLFGLGLLGAIASLDDGAAADAAVALAMVGGVGLVHHTSRWRASVRLSVDLDTLYATIPTVVP